MVAFSTGLTTLAIHASDMMKDPTSDLAASVAGSVKERCPKEMAYIENGDSGFCIDRYETSSGEKCAYSSPRNEFETRANVTDPVCLPVSKEGVAPWVNVELHQALAVCAKAGKRLPTNREWYRAALGTPDVVSPDDPNECALGRTGQSAADRSGAHSRCVSSFGVYDMVGNVWEWVDGEVENGRFEGRELPLEGFVSQVDSSGVPIETSTTSELAFGEDYFFIDRGGVRGMIRGGFWSLKERAGIFDVNATIPTSFIGNAVGFRCARDAR